MEDRPQRRESNIYASITHHSKAAHRTAHPDDVEIHYWNEDSRFPPIQPSTESSSTSVLKPSSSDIEESMYLNPLYSGSEKESESTQVTASLYMCMERWNELCSQTLDELIVASYQCVVI